MRKNLSKISFSFENVEGADVSSEHIETFIVEGSNKYEIKDFENMKNEMFFDEKLNVYFVLKESSRFEHHYLYDDLDVIERMLKHNDITSIHLLYSDGTSQDIPFEWKDWDYENNDFQTAGLIKGKLHVLIDPNKTISSFESDFDIIY